MVQSTETRHFLCKITLASFFSCPLLNGSFLADRGSRERKSYSISNAISDNAPWRCELFISGVWRNLVHGISISILWLNQGDDYLRTGMKMLLFLSLSWHRWFYVLCSHPFWLTIISSFLNNFFVNTSWTPTAFTFSLFTDKIPNRRVYCDSHS